MKITGIAVYQADLPYAGGTYRLSGGREYTSFDATFARVITECGLDGWGESTPFGPNYIAAHARGVRAGLAELAPAVMGLDPRQHPRLYDAMDGALLGHSHAKTPIDVACWDIHGKSTGQPVCDLLGGRIPGQVPYISSIGGDTPEAMRQNVEDHRARGFKSHSIKIGASEADGGPTLDAARIEACLADRQPGEWFLADANNGMTPEQVLRLLNILPQGLDFVLEALCNSWRETLSLRSRTSVPILLDELIIEDRDIIHAIATDACDGIGLKISKQGGLTPTLRQMLICNAAGLVVSVQETTGSDIAFAAIAHMAQATPRAILRSALDTRSMVAQQTAEFDESLTTPGLGITPDMDALGAPIAVYEG